MWKTDLSYSISIPFKIQRKPGIALDFSRHYRIYAVIVRQVVQILGTCVKTGLLEPSTSSSCVFQTEMAKFGIMVNDQMRQASIYVHCPGSIT